jgi:lipase
VGDGSIETSVVFIHGHIGTLQAPDMTAAFALGWALAPELLGYGAQRQVPPDSIDLLVQSTCID